MDYLDDSINVLLVHVRMFELAVKFQVDNLQDHAFKRFTDEMRALPPEMPGAFILQVVREIFTKIPEDEGALLRAELLTTDSGQSLMMRIAGTQEFKELCEECGSVGHAFYTARFYYDHAQKVQFYNENAALKLDRHRLTMEALNKDMQIGRLIHKLESAKERAKLAEDRIEKLITRNQLLQSESVLSHSNSVYMRTDKPLFECTQERCFNNRKYRLQLKGDHQGLKGMCLVASCPQCNRSEIFRRKKPDGWMGSLGGYKVMEQVSKPSSSYNKGD